MTLPRPSDLDTLDLDGVTLRFAEIYRVVDVFYSQVQKDPQLKIPFGSVKDWAHHVDRLTHFWWIRLGGRPYQQGMYNPVEKHFLAGFNQVLLTRWLELFRETLRKNLESKAADRWDEIASSMGDALLFKNQQYAAYQQRK